MSANQYLTERLFSSKPLFSALTLLVWRREGRTSYKKLGVGLLVVTI